MPYVSMHNQMMHAWHARISLGQHTRSHDVGYGMPSPHLGSTHSDDIGRDMSTSPLGSTNIHSTSEWHAKWPLGRTHGRMTSGLTCYHRPRTAHAIRARSAWHAFMAFVKHTLSYDVGRCMPSLPLGSTHGPTTSGVTCYHSPWAGIIAFRMNTWLDDVRRGMPSSPFDSIHKVGRHLPRHANISLKHHTLSRNVGSGIALGKHTGPDDVGCGMLSSLLDSTQIRPQRAAHMLNDIRRGMQSLPLDNINNQTPPGRHAIIALGMITQSDDIGHGKPSSPKESIHKNGLHWALIAITALGQHTRSDYIGHGVLSSPLDSTNDRMTSSVACPHGPWAIHTIARHQHTRSDDVGCGMPSFPLDNIHGRRCRALHAIIALVHHTRSDHVGRSMTSSPLEIIHDRTTFVLAWNHHPLTANMIGPHKVPHACMALVLHKRSDMPGLACHYRSWAAHTDPRRQEWHAIISIRKTHDHQYGAWYAVVDLGRDTRSDEVRRCMLSSPLGSTRSQTTSGFTCYLRLWTTHIVVRRRAWHVVIALVQPTQSYDFGCGMLSSPLDNTHDRMMSSVTCPHGPWEAHTVTRHRAWQCYHLPWVAHTFK
ncbi:hypothetical protein EJD97_006878 [Solanum chilense]|uniref:Uncharacterized protein n=1 Tax=Solanum chilense TaxID=4083 RepID=A0A6N2AK52_SOLCI|nr:hypothetical protein EJD97_006878 [Solanum chilense]